MLKEKIQADTVSALKAKNQELVEVLRMLSSAVSAKEKEKRYILAKEGVAEAELAEKSVMTDEEVITVVSSEIKKRKDAIALYEQGGRPELAEKEKKEIEMLKGYLPEQLSPEELKGIVEQSVKNVGAKEMKDMG